VYAPPSRPGGLGGKVAIVTGAARGSGAAICRALAREGAAVVACDILPTDATMAAVQAHGVSGVGVECNVSKKNDVARVVEAALDGFGRIDILVSNAGYVGSGDMQVPVEEFGLEDWDRVFDVNLKGQFLFCQAVWPTMRKQQAGKIICLGSMAGKSGGLVVGPHYCASKGGVHTLVKWLAKRGASDGIYVNGIAPGAIDTEMIRTTPIDPRLVPLGRLGLPEDIAEGVVFLASDASNYITGPVLDINGGIFMF
jgi:3-oxoacyl-[acyl-carrier protein] reductase